MSSLVGATLDGRYQIKDLLGQGQFAHVLLATDASGGSKQVAIKAPKDVAESRESFDAELEFLRCMEQASAGGPSGFLGVLLLRRVFELERSAVCFVFDVVSCDLLRVHKDYRDGLSLTATCRIAKDVALGLQFLHNACGILHMDIKLENIGVLFGDSISSPSLCRQDSGPVFGTWEGPTSSSAAPGFGVAEAPSFGSMPSFGPDSAPGFGAPAFGDAPAFGAPPAFGDAPAFGDRPGSALDLSQGRLSSQSTRFCLFDFGNATWLESARQAAVEQTVTYRSPEVVVQVRPRTPAADMWSFGCVLWELACGRRFYEPSHEDMTADGTRSQRISQAARIQSLLQEAMPEHLAQALLALGASPPPSYPVADERQRAARLSQLLRAVQPSSGAATDVAGLLAGLLALDPAARATAKEAMELATDLEELSGSRQTSKGVVCEVDELDLALSPNGP